MGPRIQYGINLPRRLEVHLTLHPLTLIREILCGLDFAPVQGWSLVLVVRDPRREAGERFACGLDYCAFGWRFGPR